MKISNLLLTFICLICLICSGCSIMKPVPTHPTNTYELTALATVKQKQPKATAASLFINNTLTSPGYETSGIAYSKTPYQLAYFSRNRWIAPPAQLINKSLVNSFQQAGYFKYIVTPPYIEQHDLRLDTRLVELKQDLQTQPSQVIIKLQAQLIDVKTQQIIASKQFTVTKPISQNNPQAVVMATNEELTQLLNQLILFCIKYAEYHNA